MNTDFLPVNTNCNSVLVAPAARGFHHPNYRRLEALLNPTSWPILEIRSQLATDRFKRNTSDNGSTPAGAIHQLDRIAVVFAEPRQVETVTLEFAK